MTGRAEPLPHKLHYHHGGEIYPSHPQPRAQIFCILVAGLISAVASQTADGDAPVLTHLEHLEESEK